MEFSFECRCGAETIGHTMGMDEATSRCKIRCESCDAIYAVTITNLHVDDSPNEVAAEHCK